MQLRGMSTLQRARSLVRLATSDDHEAIHRLNYRTFVEEIPQHAPNDERRLVDRFHGENCYAVYEVDGVVVGMVAGRTTRPFSLDTKLGGVDQFLPAGCRPAEIRLLAVDRAHRSTRACTALVAFITRHLLAQGFDTGVISGTTRQLALYRHLGFREFGPLVGQEGAWYQPMQISIAEVAGWSRALPVTEVNCLPGPVEMRKEVHAALRALPLSHRAPDFRRAYDDAVARLCEMTGATAATILLGSGTLANDVVAAALTSIGPRGIVAVNGEFGERLADHARRAGLSVTEVRSAWGDPLDYHGIAREAAERDASWVWAVHCETSTGVLNDLERLRGIARTHHCELALDAISSVGTIPVDLRGVRLASAVSGKALGSYAGLAIVFHDGAPAQRSHVPRYLDLAFAHAQRGVPFTHSSNLVDALRAALSRDNWLARFAHIAHVSAQLRADLERRGLHALAPRELASPAVLTIPTGDVCSRALGDALRDAGVLVSYESAYLADRNWIQLCLMGEWQDDAMLRVPAMIDATRAKLRASRPSAQMRHADRSRHPVATVSAGSAEFA